jgi:hypothetical protein
MPFYLVLNLACGGILGGNFDNSEEYIYDTLSELNEYHIKYVKVFKTRDGFGQVIKY